jgi:hypothetical protein
MKYYFYSFIFKSFDENLPTKSVVSSAKNATSQVVFISYVPKLPWLRSGLDSHFTLLSVLQFTSHMLLQCQAF